MKNTKIRGHKRIWKEIEEWRKSSLEIDAEWVVQKYVKIRINPYMTYALWDKPYAEPNGETRKRILSALLDIYDAWKKELDAVGEPYYLKLWLIEPQFTKSQVVCGARDALNFYDKMFPKPAEKKTFPYQNYGKLEESLKEFTWEHGHYENFINEDSIGEPEDFVSFKEYYANRRWVRRKLAGPNTKVTSPQGGESCYFKIGDIWLGSRDQ